jgi:hypothetical protein
MYIEYIGFFIREVSGKSYILDVPSVYHVHPFRKGVQSGG